jgi:hypothetical protein
MAKRPWLVCRILHLVEQSLTGIETSLNMGCSDTDSVTAADYLSKIKLNQPIPPATGIYYRPLYSIPNQITVQLSTIGFEITTTGARILRARPQSRLMWAKTYPYQNLVTRRARVVSVGIGSSPSAVQRCRRNGVRTLM